jgi:hypothetical protein
VDGDVVDPGTRTPGAREVPEVAAARFAGSVQGGHLHAPTSTRSARPAGAHDPVAVHGGEGDKRTDKSRHPNVPAQFLAAEWPKVGARSVWAAGAAFKRRIPEPFPAMDRVSISARSTSLRRLFVIEKVQVSAPGRRPTFLDRGTTDSEECYLYSGKGTS